MTAENTVMKLQDDICYIYLKLNRVLGGNGVFIFLKLFRIGAKENES